MNVAKIRAALKKRKRNPNVSIYNLSFILTGKCIQWNQENLQMLNLCLWIFSGVLPRPTPIQKVLSYLWIPNAIINMITIIILPFGCKLFIFNFKGLEYMFTSID